jgi:hypothetical protein
MKKLSLSNAKILLKLVEKQTINGSEFKDKKFLALLVEENILKIQQLNRSQSKIHLYSKEDLRTYLKNEFDINDLKKYIEVMEDDESLRRDLIDVSGDSKTKNIQTQTGLYLAGYENVILNINDKKFNIANILERTSLFIHQNTKFSFDKDILIVGVENVENLLQIKKQKYLFEHIKKAKLFILINPPMLKFIQNYQNEYLHFGDFDLAGVSIYETKINPKVKKSRFFIPDNIEDMLKNGNEKLYFKQYEKYKNIKSEDKNVQNLIDMINSYQKTLEQEIFVIK